MFLIHHEGFDETRSYGNYSAGWFSIKVEPGDTQEQLAIAAEIDALFANSESETKTATEQSFLESFSNQYADIGLVLKTVMVAVVATLLVVCASTITQSARERQRDFAVLQTMGFRVPWISVWIALESFFIVLLGALLGIAMAKLIAGHLKAAFTELIPEVAIGLGDLGSGLLAAVLVGLLATIFPMMELSRTPMVKTLSRR